MMNYLLANLSDDYLQQIAIFFAAQHPPYPPPVPAEASAAVLNADACWSARASPPKASRPAPVPRCRIGRRAAGHSRLAGPAA
jgi:cytochrome c553